ncbi:MAG: YfcC family protein, partial [Planctomycetota bacterium]
GFDLPQGIRFTPSRMLILAIFVGGVAFFVWGAKVHEWYIGELTAVFLGIGLLAAIIARMTPNRVSRLFIKGAAEMTSAALLIGFAKTISVVMDKGMIKDTVIHSIAGLLEGTSSYVAALGMLAVQTVCNLFIPSGSGQAFVTMPIMSPLATVTEVPQQCAVLAYQFGDGFTNMLVPTSAILMGVLTLGRIPYTRWVRFVTPLLIKLFLVAIAALIFSVHFADLIGYAD